MAQATVTEDRLVVRMDQSDRVWTFKGILEVPLEHVVDVEVDPKKARIPWSGLPVREKGSGLPGMMAAGDVRHDGQWVFWDVSHPERAVIIHLADERYARLVVEVDDPAATAAAITGAVRGRTVR
jgi:hypothetical protein